MHWNRPVREQIHHPDHDLIKKSNKKQKCNDFTQTNQWNNYHWRGYVVVSHFILHFYFFFIPVVFSCLNNTMPSSVCFLFIISIKLYFWVFFFNASYYSSIFFIMLYVINGYILAYDTHWKKYWALHIHFNRDLLQYYSIVDGCTGTCTCIGMSSFMSMPRVCLVAAMITVHVHLFTLAQQAYDPYN